MTIEPVKIKENEDLDAQFKELSEDEQVYVIYNVYNSTVKLYAGQKIYHLDYLKFENCWKMRTFKDYYEQLKDEPFFKEKMVMRIHKEVCLIRVQMEDN